MQDTMLLLVLFTMLTCFAPCRALTQLQYEAERAFLRAMITADESIPEVVRLAFHDCVGGCDGCLDFSNKDNRGLEPIVESLSNAYVTRGLSDAVLSRADFFALAGVVGVELGAENNRCTWKNFVSFLPAFFLPSLLCQPTIPSITFKTGRVSCNLASPPQNKFPDGHFGLPEVISFFNDTFGFSARDSVAIMGAHTLGELAGNNSGFDGSWVKQQDVLNNAYYIDMLNAELRWTQQKNVAFNDEAARYQWNQQTAPFMMLNSDMCLIKDLGTVADSGAVACTYSTCADASTLPIVKEYANDNDHWLNQFAVAFQKMIDFGQKNLTPIRP